MDGGPNTKACLALGRKLAEYVEPYDLPGNWMAHHLAELITAAEDEEVTTVEQRLQIVDTILKLWMNRRSLPGLFPGYDFEKIFAALERLGDERPRRFARLPLDTEEPTEGEATQLSLVATAADLERLVRETVITLMVVAHNEALESAAEWVGASSALNTEFEGELSSVSARIHRQLREYQGLAAEEDPDSAIADPEGSPTPDELDDQLSDYNHARRLREMADLLMKIASSLYPEPPTPASG